MSIEYSEEVAIRGHPVGQVIGKCFEAQLDGALCDEAGATRFLEDLLSQMTPTDSGRCDVE